MGSKILAFLLMTGAAFGQAVCVTNRTHVGLPLGPLLNPITSMQRGDELRHNNYAFDGSGPVDLGASVVKYEIVSGPTMSISRTNVTYTATILGPGLTQVIITPTIPAGQYYTKFIQYQANNSNYIRTLSWDTLIITNPPSASGGGGVTVVISNQHMASLRSDSAPTGRVAVSRADGGVDLLPWGGGSTSTGITVESDPIYSASPWASTSPTAIIAAASSGGGFTVSNNADGKVGYQTGSDFVTWEGATIATGTTLHLSFESADDLTNFYLLNWGVYTAEVVRGRLVVSASAESVDQTRAMAISNPAPSTACFVTAKMIGSGAVGGSANQQYGIGMGVSATNTWRMLRLRQAAGFRHFRGYDNNLISAGVFATGGTGTHAADPNATLESITIEQFPIWVGADHDGSLTLRYFVAKDNGFGQPGRWVQIGSKTNATPGSYWGLVFSSPTYSQGSPSWVLDDFTFTSGSLLK